MAYGTTGAGTITKEQTLLSIRRISVAATTTITKGEVCNVDTSGDLVTSTTSQVAEVPHYVALETVDNSGGSAGDLFCPVAIGGHYVTVIADGVIEPGERVVSSGTTAGQVIAYVAASHTIDQVVGTYFGKEGGTIAKSATTPYAETFTDSADFSPVPSADGDVIEILLGMGN
jgi:hypothetical protein